MLKDNIDKNLPYPFGWLTEYLYVLAGLVLTIAVQSSSIVLAILTPIVAIGVVSIDRAYPITIGANIGTTITGLIAAFANASGNFHDALAVSNFHSSFDNNKTLLGITFSYVFQYLWILSVLFDSDYTCASNKSVELDWKNGQ